MAIYFTEPTEARLTIIELIETILGTMNYSLNTFIALREQMILLRRSFSCECALQSSGTLARDILRMKADDFPRYSCDLEVIGNDLREVEQKSMPYDEVDPDIDDCTGSEEVAKFTPHRIRCQKKAFQEVINIV